MDLGNRNLLVKDHIKIHSETADPARAGFSFTVQYGVLTGALTSIPRPQPSTFTGKPSAMISPRIETELVPIFQGVCEHESCGRWFQPGAGERHRRSHLCSKSYIEPS